MSQTGSKAGRPFSIEDVPWEEWSEGRRFGSRAKALGRFGGCSHFGVIMEELPPGMQSSPFHYHTQEEEHIWILSGTVTLRLGGERLTLKEGDYIVFPAGQPVGHTLINETNKPCRFLVIGERNANDVCVYPDSGKILVRSVGEIYDKNATKDYWDGEV
jgi:uncharacterized cupin superfamily protein